MFYSQKGEKESASETFDNISYYQKLWFLPVVCTCASACTCTCKCTLLELKFEKSDSFCLVVHVGFAGDA